MGLEISTNLLVREAMSSPVISINEDSNIVQISKLMKDGRIGAIIVTNREEQPVGIVTERDIVIRVVSDGKDPYKILAKEVMTSPIKMVKPEMSLVEAMSLMDKLNIRRLGVIYKHQLVGVISDRNILRVIPTIIAIMKETSEINNPASQVGPSLSGYCDRCEVYSNNLRAIDGEFICPDCRIDNE